MPALSFANETGASFSKPELTVWLKNHFNLRDAELQEKTEGQTKTQFESDVQWVNWKLKKYRFTQSTSHGRAQITDAGRRLLAEHQGDITEAQLRARYNSSRSRDEITISVLNSNPDDRLEQSSFSNHLSEDTLEDDGEVIPEDLMQKGYRQLQDKLADELMDSISSVSPDRFERLVVELLENMGYGKGQAVGRSGDGGIDGIINQDALGLERVYIQAKRYTSGSVGEPEIRNFSGSLDPHGATKGVFITTSIFSSTARQTARNISAGNKFIRLVDGDELARLMIRYGVGVVTEYTYEVKKLDENYFAEGV